MADHTGTGWNPTTTNSPSLTFGNWREPSSASGTFVEVNPTVSGNGTTTGEVAIDIDESGGTTADRTKQLTVATGLTGNITLGRHAEFYVPPGGSYRLRNVSDPNSNNAVGDVREVIG